MMMQFQITLKNKKIKAYNLFAWLIALIVYSIEIYFTFSDDAKKGERFWIVVTLGICLLFLIIIRGFSLHNWGKREYLGAAYGFLLVPLLKWKFYWIAAALFLFVILFTIASRKFTVFVSKLNIIYPSFPSRKIGWENLNNCLLKDGLLTIDFKNNKLIQQPIDDSKTSVNEKEFNEFCQRQLNKCI